MQVWPGPAAKADLGSTMETRITLLNISTLKIKPHAGMGDARGPACCTQLELLWLKKEARSSSDIPETSPGGPKPLSDAALASLGIQVILHPNQIFQEHQNATA